MCIRDRIRTVGQLAGTHTAPGESRATRGKNATPRVDLGNETILLNVVGRAELVLPEDDADGDAVDTAVATVDDEGGRGRIVPACGCNCCSYRPARCSCGPHGRPRWPPRYRSRLRRHHPAEAQRLPCPSHPQSLFCFQSQHEGWRFSRG